MATTLWCFADVPVRARSLCCRLSLLSCPLYRRADLFYSSACSLALLPLRLRPSCLFSRHLSCRRGSFSCHGRASLCLLVPSPSPAAPLCQSLSSFGFFWCSRVPLVVRVSSSSPSSSLIARSCTSVSGPAGLSACACVSLSFCWVVRAFHLRLYCVPLCFQRFSWVSASVSYFPSIRLGSWCPVVIFARHVASLSRCAQLSKVHWFSLLPCVTLVSPAFL